MEEIKTEEQAKIGLIKEFIDTCPLLEDGKIVVDYLKEDVNSYSIIQSSSNPVVTRYKGGDTIRQITFDFVVQAPISSRNIDNLANSKFCEDFMQWIEIQDKKRNLPKIEGVQHINCTSPRIHFTKNKYASNLFNKYELHLLPRSL